VYANVEQNRIVEKADQLPCPLGLRQQCLSVESLEPKQYRSEATLAGFVHPVKGSGRSRARHEQLFPASRICGNARPKFTVEQPD
jgi:hypothetical protein